MNKILISVLLVAIILSNISYSYNLEKLNTEKDITNNFYYNIDYKNDKINILLSMGQDLRGGLKNCLELGNKYFYSQIDINKFCMYQIKNLLKEINHPLSSRYPYNIAAESNFFYTHGKKVINNPIFKYININDKESKETINYSEYMVKYNDIDVNKYILDDLYEMSNVHKEKFGQDIILNSGYRSIDKQKEIYDYYVVTYGKEQKIATLPGYSEHHLGTAIDIKKITLENGEKNYDWLKKNSWKYGFIVSYNENCLNNGIINEDWHYRWVGKKIALEWKNWEYDNKDKCNIEFLKELNRK